jgi:hypothetical protein
MGSFPQNRLRRANFLESEIVGVNRTALGKPPQNSAKIVNANSVMQVLWQV